MTARVHYFHDKGGISPNQTSNSQSFRKIPEEIALQSLADFKEQRQSDPLGRENLIDILWRAVHLLGQPDRRAALPRQLCLDQPTQVELI